MVKILTTAYYSDRVSSKIGAYLHLFEICNFTKRYQRYDTNLLYWHFYCNWSSLSV